MAAGLPATPWIEPPQIAEHFTRGFGLGEQAASEQARLAMEQQRLQQQAAAEQAQLAQHSQQVQTEMEQRKQEHERQFLMQQQQMEIAKQYHQQQMALGQQKLQEAKQLREERFKYDARRAQLAMGKEAEIKNMMEGEGLDRSNAEIQWAVRHGAELAGPGFNVGSVIEAAARMQKQATAPDDAAKKEAQKQFDDLDKRRFELEKLLLGAKDEEAAGQIKSLIGTILNRQARLQAQMGKTRGQPASVPPGVGVDPGVPTPAGKGSALDIQRDASGRLVVVGGAGSTGTNAPPAAPGSAPTKPAATSLWKAKIPLPTGADVEGLKTEARTLGKVGAGKFLSTPIGKALADITEGVAGIYDLPTLDKFKLRERIQQLRDDVVEASRQYEQQSE